ncbi:MAG: hypothetical protein KDK30_17820 [Leptospiraceae bacterium]|nr:hypothetical protein [Leptospiraceae bacterium]
MQYNLKADAVQKLAEFELNLRPEQPEAGLFVPSIIGYGEMSTVFTFADESLAGRAYKRMAIFQALPEAERYLQDYLEYNQLLLEREIDIPEYGAEIVSGKRGEPVLYLSQSMLNPNCIGHKVIHTVSEAESLRLFQAVLRRLSGVFASNRTRAAATADRIELGFDAQLSNWCVRNYDGTSERLPDRVELAYIDTSTPLVRKNGTLQINPELFLRVCPASLVWIIRIFFLHDVLNRYFDQRLVLIDLIANLIKEKRPQLIDPFVAVANQYLETYFAGQAQPESKTDQKKSNRPEASRNQNNDPRESVEKAFQPIVRKEVEDYYREDAIIWRLFLGLRRTERWIRTRILRRPYDLILPGKIER